MVVNDLSGMVYLVHQQLSARTCKFPTVFDSDILQ
jgi:hypothetical protein